MKSFTLREVVQATGGCYAGDSKALECEVKYVTSDSRTAGPGALFVAIKGSRVDGHAYVADCMAKGAVASIVEQMPADDQLPAVLVDSSIKALGRLAAWHRTRFDIPVVGITGSVGKTTTKEMIASVLSTHFNTLKTEKNFNNELGVPWTLLRLDQDHQAAVIEMGISDFGEMRRLTNMVHPDIAVFTLIGDSHLEFLGNREGVLRAKSEIFEGMGQNGLAVLNGDDPLLSALRPGMRVVTYGRNASNDIVAENVRVIVRDCDYSNSQIAFTVHHPSGRFEASIPGFTAGPLVNAALAAAAVGLELGMNPEEIIHGISNYQTVGDRARIVEAGSVKVISDCYNANPNSAKAALEALSGMSGRRVCILGDMLELGASSDDLHRQVGRYAADKGIELVIGCGANARFVTDGALSAGANAMHYADKSEMLRALEQILLPGDTVLVKASHSMHFEDIVDRIVQLFK